MTRPPQPAPSAAAAKPSQWADLWVHPNVLRTGGRALHRVRTQMWIAFLGLIVFLAAALVQVFDGLDAMGDRLELALYAGGAVGAVAVLVVQRTLGRPRLSGHGLAAVTFGFGWATTVMGGGLASPGLYWLPMTPLLAFVCVGSGASMVWLWGVLVTLTGIYISEVYGRGMESIFAPTNDVDHNLAHVLVIAVVMVAVAYSWERGQRAVVSDLEDARDRATAADQGKSNLVAIVSHELRTPMNGVLGMLDLLRDTELDDLQMRYADTARGAARSLLDILDDLLDRSRIDAGRLGIDAITFRASDVLESVENLVDLGGFGRSVPVRFEMGEGVSTSMVGDPRRLRQIVNNLVGNALKFTRQGEVVVRSRTSERDGRLWLSLEVHDTGIGIPAERLPRVFDPFTQVDGSITRRFGGTGLGLSITRDMVQMMGGTIEVQSAEGEGTSFYVEVPFDRAESTVVEEPTEPAAPRLWYGGVKVLVAEDNAVNQMVVRGFLQRHGVEPALVSDGQAAVAAAQEGGFDLVLMDCEMPVMDGFAATAALRDAGYSGPIVALTAHASASVRARCMEAGMNDFLTKPISTAALIKMLYTYVGPREEDAGVA